MSRLATAGAAAGRGHAVTRSRHPSPSLTAFLPAVASPAAPGRAVPLGPVAVSPASAAVTPDGNDA
jgi:hypothetical protein